MRAFKPKTRRSVLLLSSSLFSAATGSAGCGVAVEDRTPAVLARTPSNTYDLTARIETAGPATNITDVEAVTAYGAFPMMPGGAPLEWVAQLPLDPCVNGFDVQYVVHWQLPPAGNIEREPQFGVHQKWLTGNPPSFCNPIGHRFTVTSTVDLPDDAPDDDQTRRYS